MDKEVKKDRRGRVQEVIQRNNEYFECSRCGSNDQKVIYYPDSGLSQTRECLNCRKTY